MTAQGRTTASRLNLGDRILVEFLSDGTPTSTTRKLTGKNGVVVAIVEGLNNAAPVDQYGNRRRVTYRRIHTDQGSFDAAPSQTFALAPSELSAAQVEETQAWLDTVDHEELIADLADLRASELGEIASAGTIRNGVVELAHEHEDGDEGPGSGPCTDACVATHPDHADTRGEKGLEPVVVDGETVGYRETVYATPEAAAEAKLDSLQLTGSADVDTPAQRISFGPSLPSSFADAVEGLARTIAPRGVIAVRTYVLNGTVGELVDYQLRAVTSDPALTRDGEPHLAVVRADKDGNAISRSVELIPLDEVHTLHVY